jgi:hypothetical protein
MSKNGSKVFIDMNELRREDSKYRNSTSAHGNHHSMHQGFKSVLSADKNYINTQY